MPEIYRQLELALLEPNARRKCERVASVRDQWRRGALRLDADGEPLPIDDPGRPGQPGLVDPRQLERRSFATHEGRLRLLHAIAHIEFNAINIALDAAYRFRDVPTDFIDDWLGVAGEEAVHFQLLDAELRRRGSRYGAYRAHRGLWDMVCRTRGDLLQRMALVPRVMEARGLDVTPAMLDKFSQFGDQAAVGILRIIYRDEIGHVAIGNRWYRYACELQGVDAQTRFAELVESHLGGKLRGPFNRAARLEAGFAESELAALERRG